MKKFRIIFSIYEEYYVEAESAEEAEEKVLDGLVKESDRHIFDKSIEEVK